jgi:hypothetical protein
VVETLGQAASGPSAELVVICIPDGVDWGIADYDGAERVETTSDPNERLRLHVKVTRGRSPRTDRG